MNKEYTYFDDKVIVSDEFGNQRQIEYCDNVDKILFHENVIETMEQKIEELEKKNQKYKKIKSNKLFCIVPLLGGIITSLIGPLVTISILSNQSLTTLVNNTDYSNYILSLTGMILPFGILLGLTVSTFEYMQYLKEMKKANGINAELDYLRKEIVKEKEDLIILQNNKTKHQQKTHAGVVKIDNLLWLKRELEQYYQLGYDINKYNRYYRQGKLESKLPSNININLAEEYICHKKLVKKK